MTPRSLIGLLVLCAAGAVAGCAARAPQPKAPPPLTLDDLHRRPVIGQLGVPMGTVVEIEATVMAGHQTRLKALESAYLLCITHINGQPLSGPVVLEFGIPGFVSTALAADTFTLYEKKHGEAAHSLDSAQIAELEKDYVGRPVRLLVYEVGEYSGMPMNLPNDVPPWQDLGFGFSTRLIILADRG